MLVYDDGFDENGFEIGNRDLVIDPEWIEPDRQCPTCITGIDLVCRLDDRTVMCLECAYKIEARLSDKAHEIVDEGSLQYRRPWLLDIEPVSGHDWTSREGELRDPTVFLVDCMSENLAIGLGEDLELGAREIACACGMVQTRGHSNCFYCERELVR
jgi:hypothetical protein